jgi:hypothetical protein
VHLGQLRQALLRQSSLAAQLPDVRRQQFHRFLFGSQTSSVFCCRLLVYRILVTIDMQDRYGGDVGDFGKLGLLRHLCGATAQDSHPCLKPGVIWYRVADETHNADGRHTPYLNRNPRNLHRFRACDEAVYDALAAVVDRNRRSVAALERANLLPSAVYWPEVISRPRRGWFDRALKAMDGCDLVFVDPDNGIECADLRDTQARSRKFVFRSEIHSLVLQGKSVVVYHHTGRLGGTAEEQTKWQLQKLCDQFSLAEEPFGVLFRRGTTRAYLILPGPNHRDVLLERTNALVQKWGKNEWKPGKSRGHFTGPIF